MSDILILTPVGTSVVKARERDFQNPNADDESKKEIIKNAGNEIRRLYSPVADSFLTTDGKSRNPRDPHPAEISSLFAFWNGNKEHLQNKTVKVVLVHSPGVGKTCADEIKAMLENGTYFATEGVKWEVEPSEPLNSLDPEDATRFPLAMEELADVIHRNLLGFAGLVYLNVTGGYKGLVPYLTMMGIALGKRVRTFYLHEKSTRIIALPTYPVAFDVLEWRDRRGSLLAFTEEFGLTAEQKKNLREALKQTKVADLVQDRDPWGLNAVGRLIRSSYEEQRWARVSQFGRGGLLLDQLQDREVSKYLEDRCLPRWRHLSVGDRIPETVEHGRGHVQRLLELAQQLLVALGRDVSLTKEQLLVLICAIWLHDLGHSCDEFTFEGKNGLIRNAADPLSTATYSVHGKPEEVRKYHALLTYDILKRPQHLEFLFPEDRPPAISELLLKSVALACLYHRKKMPVEKPSKVDDMVYASKGIENLEEGSEVIHGFPMVAALLRFLDGLENQQERSGSEDYLKVAEWVVKRHAAFLDGCDSPLAAAEAAFKRGQLEHYRKHSSVRNVLLVRGTNESDPCNGPCAYGRSGPILELYLVANPGADGYDREAVYRDIVLDIWNEFVLIEKLVPFRISLFFVEGNERFRLRITKNAAGAQCVEEC